MIRLLAIAAATLLLASCAGKPEPAVQTIPVNVPVSVPCVPDNLEAAPVYPDANIALRAAPEVADFLKLLYAGRQLRNKRLEALEAVVEKCREIPAP